MRLHLCTSNEVRDYLKCSQGILMPIGSTEQHGPTGLIGTDAICAEVIAEATAQLTGAMTAPVIPVGMAHHHLEFPGTMALKPSTLIRVVRDQVLSLAGHGFTRFMFVNGHGGNEASLKAAFYEIYSDLRERQGKDAPHIRCTLINWWESGPVAKLARELYGDAEGHHATASEIAVTQYAYPGHIKAGELGPAAPSSAFYDARDFHHRFPDGRMGSDPSLASPEAGGKFVAAASAAIAEAYRAFTAGP